ncbi:SOS response-associated peptidase [bacterium]|nr:MAG: SOS response-associated peptidase [bacterium]
MAALYRLPDREGLERLFAVDWPSDTPVDAERGPTDPVPGVDSAGQARLFRWGFVPGWAKEANGKPLINARAETAPEKPTFRRAFQERRCALPATAFYEWREEPARFDVAQPELFDDAPKPTRAAPKRKRRYRFTNAAGLFAIAGIWEIWNGDDGSELHTCAVLTTDSNAIVTPYNERMPCVLQPEDVERWLDPRLQSLETLGEVLQGLRSEQTLVSPAEPAKDD